MLYSEGFANAKFLSKKIVTLYDLAAQQLSKQDHYDFTLRAIKSVLVTAGSLKRNDPDMPEDLVLLRALRDTNLPKFVGHDTKLFLAILSDLFPGAEPPEVFYGSLQVAVEEEFAKARLQLHPELVKKCIQLYETKLTRHGVMIVGQTGAGKTTCWKILQAALCNLKKQGSTAHNAVRVSILNPKAITNDEMYGGIDKNTKEWTDGVLAVIMRKYER
jgi:dynein heavy chain